MSSSPPFSKKTLARQVIINKRSKSRCSWTLDEFLCTVSFKLIWPSIPMLFVTKSLVWTYHGPGDSKKKKLLCHSIWVTERLLKSPLLSHTLDRMQRLGLWWMASDEDSQKNTIWSQNLVLIFYCSYSLNKIIDGCFFSSWCLSVLCQDITGCLSHRQDYRISYRVCQQSLPSYMYQAKS